MTKLLQSRTLFAVCTVLLIMAALLALDLANRGLAWQLFYALTGEERPFSQLRGMIELGGNLLRPQPNTAPLTPIQHTDVPPFGVNTFWDLEADPAKIEEQARLIAAAGFTSIRQQFRWEDIEIVGRGDFTDLRNDRNGDGQITTADAISAWEKYDAIVALAEEYSLTIQARIDSPPRWTRANPDIGDRAPPDDFQDYVNFAVAVAERYRGRIRYFEIWNEPNIYPEWGNQDVNPEQYTELLCRTYRALKAVDPEIVVISGALAPTVALSGRDLSDFVYLQRMYGAGAADCFDVLAVNGYGLNSGPTDRRMRPTTITFARNLYIRDIMVVNGDAHKSIWISEAAWNPVPDESDAPDVADRYRFGQVTPEQAARYMPEAYTRAQQEWPWIGVISYWFLTRPDDSWRNAQPQFYFRLVEPDYSEDHPTFTLTPTYTALQQYIATTPRVLYAGVHQGEDWRIERGPNAYRSFNDEAQFGSYIATDSTILTIYGTDVTLRYISQGALVIANPDTGQIYLRQTVSSSDAQTIREIRLPISTTASYHLLQIELDNGELWGFDSITVLDRTFENVFPFAALGVVGGGFMIYLLLTRRRKASA